MPVWKFRDPEEARRALWLPSGDPRIPQRLQRLAELASAPPRHPRGITRYRSIQEAQNDK